MPWQARVVDVMAQANAVAMNEHAAAATAGKKPSEKELRQWWEEMESGDKDGLGESPEEAHNTRVSTGSYGSTQEHVDGPWMRGSRHATEDLSTVFDSLGDGSMDEEDLVDPMEAGSMQGGHVGRADMMHMMDDDDDDDDLLSADGLSDDFEQLAEEGLLDDGPQDDAHEGDDLADELLCMPKAHMAADDDLKDEHLCMPTSLGKPAVETKPAAASSGPRNVFGFKDKSPERSRGMSPGRSVLDGRLMDSSPERSLPIGGVRSVLDRSPERSRDLVGPMDGTSIFMDSKVEVPVSTPVATVETTGSVLRAETQGSVLRAETEKQAGGRALDEGQTVLDPILTVATSDNPVPSATPDSELKVESAVASDAMGLVMDKGEEAVVQLPGSSQEGTSATETSADEPASGTGEERKDAPADAAESAEHVTGVDDVVVGKDSEAGETKVEKEGESDATQEAEGAQGEQSAGEKAGDSDSDAKKATARSTPPSSPSSATAAASTSFPGSVVSPRAALLLDGMPSQQELWSIHQFTNSVGGKLPSVKTIAAAAVLHDLPSAFVKLLDALVLDTVGALLMRPLVYPGMPLNQLAEEEDDDDDVDAEAWVNYDWDAVWEDEDEDDLDLRMAAMLHSKRQQQARASRSGERESSRSSRGGERESSSSRSSRHRDRDRERDRDRRDGRERHSSRDPDRERDKERRDRDRDRDRDRERRDRDRDRSERGEKDKERTRDKDSGREQERERERDGERRRERSSREREEQRARERELPEWNSNCKIDPKEKEREDRRRAREPEERRVRSERRDREGEERGESRRRERADRGDREGKEGEEKGESRRRERADRGDRDSKDSSESRRRAREAAEGEEIAEGQGGAVQDSRREGTERTSSRSSSRRANEDGEQRRRSSRRTEREAEEAGGRSSRQEPHEDEAAPRKSSSTPGERERRKGSTSAPADEARRSSRAGERGESTSSSRRSAQESLSAAVDLRAATRSRRSHKRSDDKDPKRESSRHSSRNTDSATTAKDDSAATPKPDSASRTSSSRRSSSSRSSSSAAAGKTSPKVEPKEEADVVAEPDKAVVLVDVPAEVVVDAGTVDTTPETTPAADEAPEVPQAVSESPVDPPTTEAAAAAADVPQDATSSTPAVDVEVAAVGAAAAGVAAVGVTAGLQAKDEGLQKKHAEKERESAEKEKESAAKKERKSRKEGKEKREKSKEDTRALEWQDQDPSVALQPENPADSVLPDLFKALADTTPAPPPTDLGTALPKQAGVQAPAAAESLRSPDSSNPSTPQTTTYTTSYLAPQEQLPLLFPPTNTFEMSTPRDKEIAQDVPSEPTPTPTPGHPRASSLAEAEFELLTAQAVFAPVPDGVLPEPIAHQPTPSVQNVNESSDTLDLNLHLTSTVALSPVPIPKSQLSMANDGFPSPELFSPSVTSPEPSFHEFSSPEIELISPGLESDQSNTHTLSPQPDSPSDPKVQLFTDERPQVLTDASSKDAFSDSRPQLHSDASSRGAFSEVRPQLYSDASSHGVLSDDSHPMSDDGALADESALETSVYDSHLMTTPIGTNTVPTTNTQPALSTRSTADSDSDSAGSPKARKPTSHTSRTNTINSFTDEDSDGEYPSNASSLNHITAPKGNTPPAIHSAPVPPLRVLPSNPNPDITPVPIPKLAIQSAPSPAPQPPNKLKNLLRSITGRAPKASATPLKWQEPATPQSSPQRNLKVLQEEQVQRWNHSFHAQVGPADLPELSVTTRTLSGSSQHGGVPIPRSPSVKASTSAPWKKAFDDGSPRGSLTPPQGDAAPSSTAGSSFTGRSATAGPTGYQGYDPDSPMSGASTPPIMRRESGNTASSNPDFWAGADYSRDGGRSDHLRQSTGERPLSPSGVMEVQQMKKSKGLSKAVYKMVGWVKKGKK